MTLKRKLRSVLDRSARFTGVLAWCEHRMRRGLTVLMYHRVLPDEDCLDYPLRSLVMPESAFAEQVRWLESNCKVMPFGPALATLDGERAGKRPLVAITFDDGYFDNAEIAAPILEDAGLRATFFVTTGFVSSGDLMWFDRAAASLERMPEELVREALTGLPEHARTLGDRMAFLKNHVPAERDALVQELEERANIGNRRELFLPMTVPDVRALHASGHEIGSHTITHPILPLLEARDLERELAGSRATLETWIEGDVTSLAYPNGDVDPRVTSVARRVGYEHACTTTQGIHLSHHDPLLVNRFDITRDRVFSPAGHHDVIAFRSEVSRFHDILRAG